MIGKRQETGVSKRICEDQEESGIIRRAKIRKQYYKEPEFYRYDACDNRDCDSGLEDLDSLHDVMSKDSSALRRGVVDIEEGGYSKLLKFINVPGNGSRKENKTSSYSSVGDLSDCWDMCDVSELEEWDEWEEEVFVAGKDIERDVAREKEHNLQKINFSDKMERNGKFEIKK